MQDCLGANDRWAILKEGLSENQIETPIAVCSKAEHPWVPSRRRGKLPSRVCISRPCRDSTFEDCFLMVQWKRACGAQHGAYIIQNVQFHAGIRYSCLCNSGTREPEGGNQPQFKWLGEICPPTLQLLDVCDLDWRSSNCKFRVFLIRFFRNAGRILFSAVGFSQTWTKKAVGLYSEFYDPHKTTCFGLEVVVFSESNSFSLLIPSLGLCPSWP